ncbi:hypothetical protein ACH50_22420 [Franconibacter pulveris]|uniref:Uncharacterized protein n=1 Tax=Franconibacter pulveris TaxID=435910 RepID=A0A0J8VGP8_9ENTR|nr:hypothetical protein ACH50_22420 [Franconibacter pulveris]
MSAPGKNAKKKRPAMCEHIAGRLYPFRLACRRWQAAEKCQSGDSKQRVCQVYGARRRRATFAGARVTFAGVESVRAAKVTFAGARVTFAEVKYVRAAKVTFARVEYVRAAKVTFAKALFSYAPFLHANVLRGLAAAPLTIPAPGTQNRPLKRETSSFDSASMP